MSDTFVISGLRDKRAATAGRIVDLRREVDKLQADLLHLDAVLKLYGLEPSEIPNKGRMPVRSAYFGRNEISRRCRDMLREKGTVRADEISVQAMKDKGLDPEKDRKTRTDFNRRILVSLHDLVKANVVEKVRPWTRSDMAAERSSLTYGCVTRPIREIAPIIPTAIPK